MPSSLLAGFALGFSLILAIGAQNAFVLRQGLRREHVFWICLTCAGSDAALIYAGVLGLGSLSEAVPGFELAMRLAGAGFLVWYGARSLLAARRGGAALKPDAGAAPQALLPVLATVLALTWLNPHVYLDTVVLLGSISAQYPDPMIFGLGAICASFTFFFSLGYGAALLAPVFARPRSWQVLEVVIGLTMWGIAAKLLLM
ncbi:LysE/ArgO family amino acid transporter [Phaeobacter sp. QD34_3]|uniref:LysE/ArgO family amino acid transporter n=1 Tax=unclassified Phaeobacter TaxID=2621772 RepID=UPI00237F7C51|nr:MULTISPECIES: LysE/ArgO family amino acid transporter [unclassified Phaeobacter]MDE4131926.1 LysE/ArgO family amino acid transporter [Phaeobacter sp. QD34_3]MDE4135564.1 LysE/ArgO family amino acid transporter [Phaeobacter sp. QD34_24]MDE4173553.1 LysE/ArgO family amino acid transporter [Phaeobacter sp. PT47_59]